MKLASVGPDFRYILSKLRIASAGGDARAARTLRAFNARSQAAKRLAKQEPWQRLVGCEMQAPGRADFLNEGLKQAAARLRKELCKQGADMGWLGKLTVRPPSWTPEMSVTGAGTNVLMKTKGLPGYVKNQGVKAYSLFPEAWRARFDRTGKAVAQEFGNTKKYPRGASIQEIGDKVSPEYPELSKPEVVRTALTKGLPAVAEQVAAR